MASAFQELIQPLLQSELEIPLIGAQKGLVLSITPEDGIVHWPGARLLTTMLDPSRLVDMVEILPYQDGNTLPSEDLGSIEILDRTATVESGTNGTLSHSREVLMVRAPPQIPMPQPPDVQSGDESLSNILPNAPAPTNEEED